MLAIRQEIEIPDLGMLSHSDQFRFHALRRQVGGPESRYNQNQRIQLFSASFAAIFSFCVQNESTDWLRFLVCRVMWLTPEEIALNAR
jgi:hypothetical protein